ncbi:hypothetical protein KXX52_003555, partial [Aspergillus fumigatus]
KLQRAQKTSLEVVDPLVLLGVNLDIGIPSLDTYAPLECTEAGETFLGMVKCSPGIGSVR